MRKIPLLLALVWATCALWCVSLVLKRRQWVLFEVLGVTLVTMVAALLAVLEEHRGAVPEERVTVLPALAGEPEFIIVGAKRAGSRWG